MPTPVQKQHVQEHRKYLLRKRLLRWAAPGAAYVPFCGDGDLALELYGDRQVYAADLDPKRVRNATARLPLSAQVVEADVEEWPFPGLNDPIAVADFDAYANPYTAFRAFWAEAPLGDRLVLFFTDGLPQAAIRTTVPRWTKLTGQVEMIDNADITRKRQVFHHYFAKCVWPLFVDYIGDGWRVVDRMRYRRASMLYWGAAIERRA